MQPQIVFLTITTVLLAIPIAALIYLRHIIALNDYICVVLGLTAQGTELLGTLEVQLLFYYVPGAILFCLRAYLPDSSPDDPPPKPTWLPFRYRRIPHSKPSNSSSSSSSSSHNITTRRMLNTVLLNHIFIILAYALVLALVPSPFTHSAVNFPSLAKIAADTIFAVLLGDFLTYLVHRKFHTSPAIYKHIHSMHHKYRESNALAAHYVHPLEAVLMNWMAIWAPLAGMGWFWKYTDIRLGSATGTFSWLGYFGFPWVTKGVHVVEWYILWSGVLFWSVVVHGGVEPVRIKEIDGNVGQSKLTDGCESGSINIPWGRSGASQKTIPRWNLLKRHDLHHEVGGGAGQVQSAVDLRGKPRRWGNFAPFWWMDAIFGTEIECLDHPRGLSGISK
ncbi:hypothetical protein BGX38DRAFT_1207224 [Terfezia claveryi]|nr:hypothetical protein BGX38DRAFT_1207224 [Terfezia claveryi]